ncbi:unnamed protein product [Notodromas monacha]|uniref:Amino acid transporter transmembrane domain-containing protein n=1 Tax=Notodromas monacha TaxID=399045 RepID=A0A7R9BGZ5_9CRUS|nr:unnamed protein product [Notodromas monacha]CAG0914220.1 unnamed protein product [Notodromas monacha]
MSEKRAVIETEPLLSPDSVGGYPELMLEGDVRAASRSGNIVDSSFSDVKRENDDPKEADTTYGLAPAERNHQHATSNMETMIHLLKGNIGTGVQAMPDALSNSGLVLGSVGVVAMGVVCIHCMHMLVMACHTLCSRLRVSTLDYADVAYHGFRTTAGPDRLRNLARCSRRIVNAFLVLTQIGFCCVYYVVHPLIRSFQFSIFQLTGDSWSVHTWLMVLFVPFCLLSLVRNLKLLSPISMTANILQAGGTTVIFYYLLRDLQPVSSRKWVAPVRQWPLYFGTAIYAFEGIGIVLPLENKMKRPADFVGCTGVLNTGMVLVTCLYTAMGFFGYLQYGDDVKGSITLNLPAGDPWAAGVQIAMTVAIFLSYALQMYVPIEILWPQVKNALPLSYSSTRYEILADYAFRIGLVLLTFALAALVPNVGLFISLVGAVSSSFLALVFPPMLDCVVFWSQLTWVRVTKNVAISLLGVLGFITGTYASLEQVFIHLGPGSGPVPIPPIVANSTFT